MLKARSAKASLFCRCLPPHTLSNTFSASPLVRLVPWLLQLTNLAVNDWLFLVWVSAS